MNRRYERNEDSQTIEDPEVLYQKIADLRHGSREERARSKARRKIRNQITLLAIGLAGGTFVGGPIYDRGFDQHDRDAQPAASSTSNSDKITQNTYRTKNGALRFLPARNRSSSKN